MKGWDFSQPLLQGYFFSVWLVCQLPGKPRPSCLISLRASHCRDPSLSNPLVLEENLTKFFRDTPQQHKGDPSVGLTTLNFQGQTLVCLGDWWRAVPWEAEGQRLQEGWRCFLKEILEVQEQAVLTGQEMRWWRIRPGWLDRGLWLVFRVTRRVYDLWKKGQETQDYRDVMRLWRETERPKPNETLIWLVL